MSIRVAINGYGRIGKNILRACFESPLYDHIQIVAINDLGDAETSAHLTAYDTVHGRFAGDVELVKDNMLVNGKPIVMLSEKNPLELPWGELEIDVVCECTGFFTTADKSGLHLQAGAKKVLISAPAKGADVTVVHGVNDEELSSQHRIISNASCTTNCLAPLAQLLNQSMGIEKGFMTTVHSYTNDQQLIDVYHHDLYRARSATHSMIPAQTGAAAAIGKVLPELAGRLDGMAVRVPTINVSLVDLTFIAERNSSVEEVNGIFLAATKEGKLSQVLSYNAQPLVSVDFNHCSYSANFDANHTRVQGNLVKVLAWYDNEWGFSNRMLDNVSAMMAAQ